MRVDMYHDAIRKFRPWYGFVPAGYHVGPMGNVARVERLYPGEYLDRIIEQTRTSSFRKSQLPRANNTAFFEFGAVFAAVIAAKNEFNMIELGAGMGPWTAAAACACIQADVSKRFFLAVEAEPTRFGWLQDNLTDNGIQPHERDLRQGVVFSRLQADAKVMFPVGAPRDAGHTARVVTNNISEGTAKRSKLHDYDEVAVYEPAKVLSLHDLLADHQGRIFDVAHIDIQGAEAGVIADTLGPMRRQVRSIVLGTHSTDIENSVRKTLSAEGWTCVFEFPINSSFDYENSSISTKGMDGFQHWINSALWLG